MGVRGFSRQEVERIFSRYDLDPPSDRQFYYWEKTGLIQVERRTPRRAVYSFQTILDLMVIAKLLDGGVPLLRIRKALDFLAAEHGWGDLSRRPCLQSIELLTDGEDIYLAKDRRHIMSLLRQPRQLGWRALVFSSEDVVQKVAAAVVHFPGWRERMKEEELAAYAEALEGGNRVTAGVG